MKRKTPVAYLLGKTVTKSNAFLTTISMIVIIVSSISVSVLNISQVEIVFENKKSGILSHIRRIRSYMSWNRKL